MSIATFANHELSRGRTRMSKQDSDDELSRAAQASRTSLLGEFLYYVRRYKRWSMVPILIALAVLGIFITLSGTGAAPFIYALF